MKTCISATLLILAQVACGPPAPAHPAAEAKAAPASPRPESAAPPEGAEPPAAGGGTPVGVSGETPPASEAAPEADEGEAPASEEGRPPAGETLPSRPQEQESSSPETSAEVPRGEVRDPRLALWGELLAKHQEGGGLRYRDLAGDRRDLDAYLAAVAEAEITGWSREERTAFRINAYNALVARGVLERYPGLESVIQEEGFFDGQRSTVAGEELTLNELERKALDLGDPRVHFAVVCASTGCPDLSGEPYGAESLEEQLASQTAAFLADPSKGLRLDAAAGTLWLSSIFDWYGGDFGGDPLAWILPRLPETRARQIRETRPAIRFIEYDWSPNDRS